MSTPKNKSVNLSSGSSCYPDVKSPFNITSNFESSEEKVRDSFGVFPTKIS